MSQHMVEPLPDDQVERALVVSAHPDDVDFGAAGTVATWTDAGIEVTYCIVTDGQAGGFDVFVSREHMVQIRREEHHKAAAVVGVADVRFLGYVDGELTASPDLVRGLTRLVREIRPQRMIIPSPERDYVRIHRSHPDHLAAGEAALRAIYPFARNPFAFPDLLDRGLQPWTVGDTWMSGHPTSNRGVDITVVVERKLAAILAHASQHADPERLEQGLRTSFAAWGRQLGFGDGRFGEGLFVVPTR